LSFKNQHQQSESKELIELRTWDWIDRFIIKENICPFAQKERANDRIELQIFDTNTVATTADIVVASLHKLQQTPTIETSLLIANTGLERFDEYLYHLDEASYQLARCGYEGVFQLASFHPEYQFEGEDKDDLSNFTNRAPYPIFHIIREQSITNALLTFKYPERIPQRNIEHCKKLGPAYFKALLSSALK